uniref:Uncharacterized protein n=1 Tax=Chromera velia CCMP2878 TaxID=1169474 RepID=A0A0G4IA02_9ALVE|eukprot:Cvel_2055.t1-p1 / transcript=Cvel_2055.t1 / gene=Cvel_2055 / organism=Chromera_velia_CCMP2878 / gene_product=hypothetical protein / transcript_product=hypothetical protein / location=Cvel_scaffold79:37452-38270(-) / protein_length=106 / sequence_SO=supercontig / SO=protein_coding / is_pseudo=false
MGGGNGGPWNDRVRLISFELSVDLPECFPSFFLLKTGRNLCTGSDWAFMTCCPKELLGDALESPDFLAMSHPNLGAPGLLIAFPLRPFFLFHLLSPLLPSSRYAFI